MLPQLQMGYKWLEMGAAYLREDLKKAAFGGQFSIFASNFMLSCMY